MNKQNFFNLALSLLSANNSVAIDDGDVILTSGDASMRFPVAPENYEVVVASDNQTATVQSLGEIALKGLPKLKRIGFSSFFPSQDYVFADAVDTTEYVNMLDDLMTSKTPCHLTIVGTPVDMDVVINTFSYGETSGTGDISFSIDFLEYKVPALSADGEAMRKLGIKTRNDILAKNKKQSVIYKQGDSIASIIGRLTTGTPSGLKSKQEKRLLKQAQDIIKGKPIRNNSVIYTDGNGHLKIGR